MSKPAPRKSSLAGVSPFMPPQAPAPALNEPAAPAAAAPAAAPVTRAPRAPKPAGGEPKNPKMNYYVEDTDQAGRIRAAYFAGRDRYGWRNMTDFQLDTMLQRVAELEREFNGGEPFTPAGAGTVSAGRPMGE